MFVNGFGRLHVVIGNCTGVGATVGILLWRCTGRSKRRVTSDAYLLIDGHPAAAGTDPKRYVPNTKLLMRRRLVLQ